jgi:mannose-6-phosphate isomerase-like protein (cupin superfamily)
MRSTHASQQIQTPGAAPELSETEFSFEPTGERFVMRSDPADTTRMTFDFHVEPGGGVEKVHCHRSQTERFHCVRGTLEVTVDGEPRRLTAGDDLELAPGTFHSLHNDGDEPVHCEVEYRPAGRNREWFQLMAAFIARTGREPGVLDLAPFIPDVDIYLKGPMLPQRLVIGYVLRPLAVLLGRRRRMLAFASEAYGRPFAW